MKDELRRKKERARMKAKMEARTIAKVRTISSRKRINSLILLIAFTAILMVASTYAWFSTQKDVTLSSLKGEVKIAEGLEGSLDGKTWGNTIDLAEAFKKESIPGNRLVKPSEMVPVSTAGETTSPNIEMLRGKVKNKKELGTIIAVSEEQATPTADNYPGYFAFDLYLKNTSREVSATTLQLNSDSKVTGKANGKVDSGLQNTVRVGFGRYTEVLDPLETAENIQGKNFGNLNLFSIWEPNANRHVDYVVTNNNISPAFTKTDYVKTYGLLSAAKGKTITDIYKEQSGVSKLQNTVKTQTTPDGPEKVQNLVSNTDGIAPFTIQANKISKIRIYVWLEGGDVDCINYASYGGEINATIGLIKDVVIK